MEILFENLRLDLFSLTFSFMFIEVIILHKTYHIPLLLIIITIKW